MANIKRRKKQDATIGSLTDADKYTILKLYKTGTTPADIAKQYPGKTSKDIRDFIYEELNDLNTMKATMQIVNKPPSLPANMTETMNEKFFAEVPNRSDAYAFYFGMTGSNEYALEASGLDLGIPKTLSAKTRKYALMVRGKYLRELPSVRKYIEELQERKLKDADIEKPQVQSEILAQIEEMKELAADDPRYRGHLLKAIEMLGKTIGAFQDNVKIEDATTKSGLELLMEKAKSSITIEDGYEVLDGED